VIQWGTGNVHGNIREALARARSLVGAKTS